MTWAISIGTLLVLLALALWGMRRGWLARGERTAAFVPTLVPVPADPGEPRSGLLPGVYVSTVLADNPLERVVAQGLGVRSQAAVQVLDAGVRIARSGATELFIPRQALLEVTTSGGQAGKFVGGDGLSVLTWQPVGVAEGVAPVPVRTAVRLRHAADRERFAQLAGALIDPVTGTQASTDEETA
jgi:hypothetical protein